jgi:hypothetical protein
VTTFSAAQVSIQSRNIRISPHIQCPKKFRFRTLEKIMTTKIAEAFPFIFHHFFLEAGGAKLLTSSSL